MNTYLDTFSTQKTITKCIIPAAGSGTRFLPATKAQPKEMLTIVDKPVIQYLIEEAIKSGIKDIIIVTGREKRSIEDHFDAAPGLESMLKEKGKEKELEIVKSISSLANIAYVRQPYPKGDGDALLRASHFIGKDEPFLVLFGDDIVMNEKRPAALQLIQAYEKKSTSIVCLERVPDSKVSSYGIVESISSEEKIHEIEKFLEKPNSEETNSRLGAIGKYVLTPDIFDCIEQAGLSAGGEKRLADGFVELLRRGGKIHGLEIEGQRYDTGDKFGLLQANIDYALQRPGLGDELREFLKSRV